MKNNRNLGSLRRNIFVRCNKNHTYVAIVVICSLIVFFQGVRFSDVDYPYIFNAMLSSNISSIDPTKGYLVEGILEDLIGISYVTMGFKPLTTQLLWWISGLALLVIVVAYSIKDRSISYSDLVLIVTFSRVIDTLSMWVGKFDPFLLSFLILTANKKRAVALVGIVLAGLSHPILTVISTAGVVLVEVAFVGIWFPAAIVAVLSAALVDAGLFYYFFPTLLSRPGLVWTKASEFLSNGKHWGLVTLLSSILVPFLSIQYFKPPLRFVANTPTMLIALWIFLIVLISGVVAYDHTRVACLLTIAPLIVLLRSQNSRNDNADVAPDFSKPFVILFLSRLAIPHIDGGYGPPISWWGLLARVYKTLVGS